MKPLHLVMQAFGPFSGKEVIDFSAIDRSFFLISGITGAGKTTIFDAIVFALYGEVSGSSKEKDTLKSDYAALETESFVSLRFLLHQKQYTVTRYPQQAYRNRAQQEGMKNSRVILELPDGEIMSNLREVNVFLIDLLGLQAEQFKQIAMLPQGEFKRLLEARSDEKEGIFRRLFQTQIFETMKIKAMEKYKEAQTAISKKAEYTEFLLQSITVPQESELAKQLAAEYRNPQEIHRALREHVEEKKQQTAILQKQAEALQLQLKNMQVSIQTCREENSAYEQKCRLEEESRRLTAMGAEMAQLQVTIQQLLAAQKLQSAWQLKEHAEEEEAQVQAAYLVQAAGCKQSEDTLLQEQAVWQSVQEYPSLLEQAKIHMERLRQQIEQFVTYKQLEAEYKASGDKLQKQSVLRQTQEAEQHILHEAYKAAQEASKKTQHVQEEWQLRQKERERLQAQNTQDTRVLEAIAHYVQLDEQVRIHAAILETSKQSYTEQRSQYMRAQEQFVLSQAGVLAKQLRPDMPCMVCGSLHHPSIAKMQEHVLKEEELLVWSKQLEKQQQTIDKQVAQGAELYSACMKQRAVIPYAEEDMSKIQSIILAQMQEAGIHLQAFMEQCQKMAELPTLSEVMRAEEDALHHVQTKEQNLAKLKEAEQEAKQQFAACSALVQNMSVQLTGLDEASLQDALTREKANYEQRQAHYLQAATQSKQAEQANHQESLALATLKSKWEQSILAVQKETAAYDALLQSFPFQETQQWIRLVNSGDDSLKMQEAVRHYEEAKALNASLLAMHHQTKEAKHDIANMELLFNGQQAEYEVLQKVCIHAERDDAAMDALAVTLHSHLQAYEKQALDVDFLRDIADVLRGNNTQRISFERYVLSAYFDAILLYANKRLQDMTYGRYTMLRQLEKGKGIAQSGLDLNVLDAYSGKERSVKTLSGGESFKAALALSLGLSDVIQSMQAGLELGTLFVDEGFGSLDSESLDMAIDTLMQLQEGGRLIGIISHVSELKTRIPTVIEVENRQGQSHIVMPCS